MAAGPEPISSGPSTLGPLVNLFQYLGGNQSKGSSTTANTADLGPLLQLLSQSMDPENLINLVQNLFSQGAQQVPGLTAQFANATGTRTSNNTMLGSSLALLNQSIAASIANAIVQQQANVSAPLAQQVAKSTQSTKQESQEEKKSGSGTKTALATVLGGGWALNKYGDKAMDKVGSAWDNLFPAPPPSAENIPNLSFGAEEGNGTGGLIPTTDFNNIAPLAAEPTLIGGGGDDSEFWTSGAGANANTEIPTDNIPNLSFGADEGDGTGGLLSDVSDFLDFADGGLVPAARSTGNKTKMLPQKKGNRYADGGEVEDTGGAETSAAPMRGRPNFGPRMLPLLTQAQNYKLTPETAPIGTEAITANPLPAGVGRSRNILNKEGSMDSGEGAFDLSGEAGHTDFGGLPSGPSGVGMALAGLAFAGAPSIASGITAGFNSLASSTIFNSLVKALTGVSDDDLGLGAEEAGQFGNEIGDLGPSQEGDSFGDFAGGGGTDEGGGSPGNDAGGGTAEGGGSAGASDGGGGGDGFEKGGPVKARKPSDFTGVDKVPAHLTPGEFVWPVDVVQFIGAEHLQAVVDAIHMPMARTGTNG